MSKISVVMATYNESAQYLTAAVDSILNQTFADFEFIIVLDNPGNDEIKELLEAYREKDQRIKLIHNTENLGLARSLNKGLQIADAPYIARMDADDIAFPTRLEKQYHYLENDPACDVLATNAIYIDEDCGELKRPHPIVNNKVAFYNASLYANLIMHPTVMFRSDVVKQVGGYRDFKTSQDYDLWLRLIKCNDRFVTMEEPLLYYRIRSNSIGQSNRAKQRAHHLYAVYLYKHEKNGKELFSEQNQTAFFNKIQMNTKEDQDRYNAAYQLYIQAKDAFASKKVLQGSALLLRSFITHREMLRTVKEAIQYKRIIRGYLYD